MKKWMLFLLVSASLWALLISGSLSYAEEAKRITKEDLKAMLGNPELVLLDVRTGKDWTASEFKIQGAVREDPQKMDDWADKYSKGKTLVLYCA